MTGVELIAAERQRQIEQEGWTASHDEQHKTGQLALVAALYATPVPLFSVKNGDQELFWWDPWPWSRQWDKRRKHGRLRRLEIAGALIAAEIDRLQAKLETESKEGP